MPRKIQHSKRRPTKRSSARNGSGTDIKSLAEDLARIGRSIPLSEWDKIPPDYFANLDAYRSGKLKVK